MQPSVQLSGPALDPTPAPELLAEGQCLLLVRGADAHALPALRPAGQSLEADLEQGLTVIDHERHLARPHFHDHLGPQDAAVARAEARIEEASIVRADLAGAGVVHYHLRGVLRGHADPLP